jgi:copper(I)-binding protein
VFQAPEIAQDGKVSVREVSAIEIAPGQSVTMQPGGMYIVFNDIQRTIASGEHFEAHLAFEGLGEIEVEVEIEPAGRAGKPGGMG